MENKKVWIWLLQSNNKGSKESKIEKRERERDEWGLLCSYSNICDGVALRGNTCCIHTSRHPTMMLSFCSLTPIFPSLLLPVPPEQVRIFFCWSECQRDVCKSESVCILHHDTLSSPSNSMETMKVRT